MKGCWPVGNTFLPFPWTPELSCGQSYRVLVFWYTPNYTGKLEEWNNLVHLTPTKQEIGLIWSALEIIPPSVSVEGNRTDKRGVRGSWGCGMEAETRVAHNLYSFGWPVLRHLQENHLSLPSQVCPFPPCTVPSIQASKISRDRWRIFLYSSIIIVMIQD